MADDQGETRFGKQKQSQPAGFEFTRRKRWLDILVSELPDLAVFVLSETGTIWYTGPAVKDLLGWKVGELIDKDVAHILNGAWRALSANLSPADLHYADDDVVDFREDMEECASSSTKFTSYARLKCKPSDANENDSSASSQKELLFELGGNFIRDTKSGEQVLFILTGKPYPSKNMAM